jgi:hypothetical protein
MQRFRIMVGPFSGPCNGAPRSPTLGRFAFQARSVVPKKNWGTAARCRNYHFAASAGRNSHPTWGIGVALRAPLWQ